MQDAKCKELARSFTFHFAFFTQVPFFITLLNGRPAGAAPAASTVDGQRSTVNTTLSDSWSVARTHVAAHPDRTHGKLPLPRLVGGSAGPHCVTPRGSLALSLAVSGSGVVRPPRAATRHASVPQSNLTRQCQRLTVNGQRSTVNGQRSTVNGQRLGWPKRASTSPRQNKCLIRTSMMFSVVLNPSSIVSRDRVHM